MDGTRNDLENLRHYIHRYLEQVLGIRGWQLKNCAQPSLGHENGFTVLSLPLELSTLEAFLGTYFALNAPRELILSILIGLTLHEVAHDISGEDHDVEPHILNNIVCDSNDFNVVPKEWPGSIPFTLSLTNATHLCSLDAGKAAEAKTPEERLKFLLGLSVTYLRKLRIRLSGKDVRTLPDDHPMSEVFEKIKILMREARRAPVQDRPRLVKELYDVLLDYWVEMTGQAGGDAGEGKGELDKILEEISLVTELPSEDMDPEGVSDLCDDSTVQDAMEKASEVIQDVDRDRNSKGKGGGKSSAPEAPFILKEMGDAACPPVNVDAGLAAGVRAALEPTLFQRTLQRRAPSVVGTRFNPARFHETKTNPDEPRIRKDILRFGQKIDESLVVLCFDRSSSMGEENKEEVAKQVCGTMFFALAMMPRVKVVILGFHEHPTLVKSAAPRIVPNVLRRINKGLEAEGGTNFCVAFREALKQARETPAHKKLVVLLTDGDLNGQPRPEETLKEAQTERIDVVCVGVEGADMGELKRIFGANAIFVPDIRRLPGEMRKVVVEKTAGQNPQEAIR